MAQLAALLDGLEGEALVGAKTRHHAADLLARICWPIRSRWHSCGPMPKAFTRVLRSQDRVRPQKFLVIRAKPARLLKQPDRNAGPANAWLPATHISLRVDPREIVDQVLDEPLEELDLFTARHSAGCFQDRE